MEERLWQRSGERSKDDLLNQLPVPPCTPTGKLSKPVLLGSLRYADDTTLMAESEEELKSLLMKVKQESEKVGLKLNI